MLETSLKHSKGWLFSLSCSLTLALSLWGNPAWAGDPFRSSNPRAIGDQTEAAFDAIFKEGNYPNASNYVNQALRNEGSEPLAHAIRASLEYTKQVGLPKEQRNWNEFKTHADHTLERGQQLISSDPLRGNIYIALGHFLQGTYALQNQGPVGAVAKLQQVFRYLDEAKKIDANDPELNLIKGYMELMLAVNLPLSSPEKAISNLQQNAAPEYLVNRGIALAYRDLKKYDEALPFADRALQATPNNPEVQYLKAQILHEKGKKDKNRVIVQQSLQLFDTALAKQNQLPSGLIPQIQRERRIAQEWLDQNP